MRKSVFICLLLTACGANESSPIADIVNGASPNSAPAVSSGAQGTAGANGIDCASVNASSPQGFDMIGVTVGMPADQAFAKIACSNPALTVEFSTSGGFRVPPPPGGGQMRTAIVARSSNETIRASLVGMPGQERVVTISRRVSYRSGEEPAVDSFQQQAQTKYGPMLQDYGTGARNIAMGHVRRPDGRPIAGNEESADYGRCLPVSASPSILSDCGPAIRFVISPKQSNRQLVSEVEAVMTDGAVGMRLIDEYTAVAGGAQRQRQQQEIDQARTRTPNL